MWTSTAAVFSLSGRPLRLYR